jgi:predicted DCC family thiol-disulfide oxidoreductase YuxK
MSAADGARAYYDGDCGVCTAVVAWLRPRLPAVTFAAFQTVDARELAACDLTVERCSEGLQLVRGGRVAASGADAFNALAVEGRLPGWRLAAVCAACPPLRSIERRVYATFARRRATISRLLGQHSCRIS